MADEQPAKKKRRIRPNNQTLRQQTEQAKAADKPKPAKKRRLRLGRVFATLAVVFKPLRWFGRHIIPRYIREAFGELKNVTWINRKQSRQLTTAVILFSIVFAFLVSMLDLGLDKVFKKVFLKE